ncbi:hypothetical protein [Algoriphagus chordae]|uniref:Uncharacterized protein n=1 Tax=Algoriphagus chordae TaxID=237019 RepID=A0A2W7QNQ8_9BACT|nr:hypothetical protein [Algoriphagus chordae]PZX50123.1 hypothetical protein LV85_02739 [Algoriphagus chordae]
MRTLNRRIILINQTFDQGQLDMRKLELNEIETFVLDPVDLFAKIDWTKFEDSVEVLNMVYADLFEAMVIDDKSLLCYWPTFNSSDEQWFELLSQCKPAGIQVQVTYTNDNFGNAREMLPEFQRLWKSFILFMIETLCEDIKLNEEFEEIACLNNLNESILLFKIIENGESRYSYLLSKETMIESEPSLESQRKLGSDNMPLFADFEGLMEELRDTIDLGDYQTTFVNRGMEKKYFNSLLKKYSSNNLIKHWIENYSQN